VRIARSALLAAVSATFLFSLTAASAASAQVAPGAPAIDWDRERSEYSVEVLRSYNDLVRNWRSAWEKRDARAAAEFYSDGAYLMMADSALIQGKEAIQAYLGGKLPEIVEIRTGLSDFVASERLAYALGPFFYQYRRGGDGILQDVSGTIITVLVREGRRWKIRSQLFRIDTPAPASASADHD
jgi:ketosteroid isomerase-like protein